MKQLKELERKIISKSRLLGRYPVIVLVTGIILMALSFTLFLAKGWLPGIAIATFILLLGFPIGMFPAILIRNNRDSLAKKYKKECKKTYLVDRLNRCGVTNCHYKEEDGLWKDELVRAGLFGKDSMMGMKTKEYLEGTIENIRFRNSKVLLQQRKLSDAKKKPYVTGRFWIFTLEEDYPCRLAIFNRRMTDVMDEDNVENRWCGSDDIFRKIDTEKDSFFDQFQIYSDNPEEAVDMLNVALQERMEEYMEKHPREAFFIGFNHQEMFFFDYSEKGIEEEFLPKPIEPRVSKNKRNIPTEHNISGIAVQAENNSNMLAKYLLDILGIFAADGVMWNTGESLTADAELDAILLEEDERAKKQGVPFNR